MLRAGVIRGFDELTYLADVELQGQASTYLTGVPVAQHLRADLLIDGARCVLLFFEALNPANALVLALFGGPPPGE